MALSQPAVLCVSCSPPQAITLLAEAPEGRRALQHLVNKVCGRGGVIDVGVAIVHKWVWLAQLVCVVH